MKNSMINRFLAVLTNKEKRQLLFLTGLTLIAAMLEPLGILMIMPLIELLSAEQIAAEPSKVLLFIKSLGLYAENASREDKIISLCMLLFAIFLIKNAYQVFFVVYQAKITRMMQKGLFIRLYFKYVFDPYRWHLQRSAAQVYRNLQHDISSIFANMILGAIFILTDAMIIIALAITLIMIEPVAALLAFCSMAFMSFLYYRFSKRFSYRIGSELRTSYADVMRWVQQAVYAIKEVKLSQREVFFAQESDKSYTRHMKANVANDVIGQLPKPWHEMLIVFGFLMVVTILMLTSKDSNVLVVVGVFALAGFRLMPSVSRLVAMLSRIHIGIASFEHLEADLKASLAYADGKLPRPQPTKALAFNQKIQVDNVSFAYDDAPDVAVLNGINLSIPHGATVGICGASGAGKSTLVNLMLGLLTPTHGKILVDGQDISENLASWLPHIGYIPQAIYLIEGTILENITLGLPPADIDMKRVAEVLEYAQLAEFVNSLENGLNSTVGENGIRLSGGQRQRIGIARALYHNPDILVLDEATASLDNITEQKFMDAILSLADKQRTIIMIAHRLSTIKNCDIIYYLEKGHVMASGTYQQLLDKCPPFQRLAQVHSPSSLEAA